MTKKNKRTRKNYTADEKAAYYIGLYHSLGKFSDEIKTVQPYGRNRDSYLAGVGKGKVAYEKFSKKGIKK